MDEKQEVLLIKSYKFFQFISSIGTIKYFV